MNALLVDGYNMMGDWPILRELKQDDFAKARDLLVDKMAEYQAYTGYDVFVIFDAYLRQGPSTQKKQFAVDVTFTSENETADECIEKMSLQLIDMYRYVYVATSDWTEQAMVFTQGGLRKSARELYTEVKNIEEHIAQDVKKQASEKPTGSIWISDDMKSIFEKWRRQQL